MRYGFGDWVLDTLRYELQRAGEVVPIRPKVFQVLAYLLTHTNRVISKQELLEQLWPGQFVEEATLNSCIMALRKTLGDSGQTPRLVHTIRGRGYRFVAPVEEGEQVPLAPRLLLDSLPVEARPGDGRSTALEGETSAVAIPSAEGELKPVTVLCCAPVDAPTLAAHLGPEALYHLLQAWMTLAQEVVQHYDGTMIHGTGEDFTALFGAPAAQEDHARRAVLAALDLHQRLRTHPALHAYVPGGAFTVRMGVHSGLVVAGALGSEAHRLYTAVGAPTHLAIRLLQHAAPGTILVSAATYGLVHREVQSEAYGALDMAGTSVPVYTVRGLQQRRAGVAGHGAQVLSRFVGRERELALLHACLTQVAQGQGQVVGIVGEPGLGKSRLLYEFRQSLGGQTVLYYEGHCLPYGQSTPYLPVRDLLRQYCGISETDHPEAITATVSRCLQEAGLGLEEALPVLLQLLDVPVATTSFTQLSPEARKARTFTVLHQVSRHASHRQPLVLAVENLHWIDSMSEEWLTTLVERLASAPILVLATYRPGYRPPWLGQSAATQVALSRLTPRDSLTVVQSVLQTMPLPAGIHQEIVAKAAGNPFFLEELAWTIREHGTPQTPLALPATVQAVLASRLDRLPPAEKSFMQTAAVIGTEVPLPLLHAVSGLAEDVLQQYLRRLQTDELVYETRLVPVSVYTFKHVLTQEVAYNSLLSTRRTRLHTVIGLAMEALYQERLAERYEELARHFSRGEAWEKAFIYLGKAGDKARHAYATQEAIGFYTRALEVSHRLTPPLDAAQLLPVHEGLGLVWMLLTKYDEAIADFRTMLQLARASGNTPKAGESLCHLAFGHFMKLSAEHMPFVEQYAQEAMQLSQQTGDQKILAKSLTNLGLVEQVRGNLQAADSKLTTSLHISRRGGYKDSLAQNLLWLGMNAQWRGEFRRTIALCQESVAVSRDIYDGHTELFSLAFLCLAHWSVGHYAEALTVVHEGMTKAKERQNTFVIGRLTNTLGWFHSELGNASRAVELDHESLELGRMYRVANVEISALINLGIDYLALGQYERARSYLESTLDRVEREAFGPHRWRWKVKLLIRLAELYAASGASEQALRAVAEGLEQARTTSSQKYVAIGWAVRGKVAAQLGDSDTAGTALQRAFALAEQLHSPTLLYPIAYDLGQWYETTGREQEAVVLYGTAKATVEHMAAAIEDEVLCTAFRQSALVQAITERAARLGI
jgi:DNA-binding winged helix-turn-helix (wHTH) protein/class 3 adenylate cyclase/tetratricopeptide (TPR) repeat protein